MDFNTGREEWDQDYVKQQQTLLEDNAKTQSTNSGPTSLINPSQHRQASSNKPSPAQSFNGFVPSQHRPVSFNSAPAIQAFNGAIPSHHRQVPFNPVSPVQPSSGPKLSRVEPLGGTSSTIIDVIRPLAPAKPKKSKTEWAHLPATSLRKQQQQVKDESDKQYLSPPTHPVEHKFQGYFLWNDEEMLSNHILRRQWDKIRLECHVFISYNRPLKSIVVQSDDMENVKGAMKRLRGTLNHIEANEESSRARYIMEPPSCTTMRREVLAANIIQKLDGKFARRMELSGQQLSSHGQSLWEEERRNIITVNEKIFKEYMKQAFAKLCELNSGMRMRVQFGYIQLMRCRAAMTQPGFPYGDVLKMMSEPQTDAEFEKSLGDIDLASKVINKINQSPTLFCPLNAMVAKLSDIKPKQKLVYCTSHGANKFRFEAEIDITARNEYQMGASSLFEKDGLKPRLSIRFLGFESKFHWSLEILSKEKFHGNGQVLHDIVRRILLSTTIERDILGFPYPTLRPGVKLNAGDEAFVETVTQYKLLGQPFILELVLCRSIESGAVSNCGISMYSRMWDDQMGPKEGEDCDQWELGSDLQALFPPLTQVDAGRPQEKDNMSGFRSFLDTVEKVRAFLGKTV